MKNDIKHSGIVEDVDARSAHVRVRILQSSACASCKAAAYCTSAESKEKIVDIYGANNVNLISKGDEVVVVASNAVAAKALLWAFGGPFVILVAVLFTLVTLGFDESLSAILSIAALIPYYLVLYFLRDKFKKSIRFSIEGH